MTRIPRGMIGLQLLLIGALLCGRGHCREIHVRVDSPSNDDCGHSWRTACPNMAAALNHVTGNDDVIFIYGNATTNEKLWLCDQSLPLINKNVSIVGYGSERVAIGCKGEKSVVFLNITNSESRVTFKNLHFHQAFFVVGAGHVTFDSCYLNLSKWYTVDSQQLVGFYFYNSTWRGFGNADVNCTVMCEPVGHLVMLGHSFKLELVDSTFYQSKINFTASFQTDIDVINTQFYGEMNGTTIFGGMYLVVRNESNNSTLRFINSVFAGHMNTHPIDSIMNIYQGSLLIMSSESNRPPRPSFVRVLVENSTFINNERGVTFIGPYHTVDIRNSYFGNNVAMHAAGGLLIYTKIPQPNGNRILVTNCTFETNAAGSFRAEHVEDYKDAFQVSRDEVRIHSPCCKGVISFVGKGGAIRVQQGNATIKDCIFKNNTARLLGGAIFVDRDGDLILESTSFENSPDDIHTLQGDLLYSNGIVSVKSARLNVLTANSHTAILRHSGNHWSIEVSDVAMQCPVGYRLRVTNTSAYGVTMTGLKRSYKLDQLSYYCESCPRNKYSLDFGYLNYSLTYSSFDYDTLLIDGNRPDNAYNGTYIYHDIECETCPYGGKCQQGIVAVPNFWGYIQDDRVKFQHCPKGYCCSSTDCKTFNTCGNHRQGVVCGECEDGFSEALFSSACVPDDQCDPTWLWPVALGSGLLYTMFLLFQKDIRDLMYVKTEDMKETPLYKKCFSQKKGRQVSDNIDGTNSKVSAIEGFYNTEQTELQALNSTENELEMEIKPPEVGSNKNNNDKQNGIADNCQSQSNDANNTDDDGNGEAPPSPADTGASFLIILFYYFQDAQLLQIKTVFGSVENKSQSMLKEILAGLFKFRVEVFQFMDQFCFLSGLTPKYKLLYKVTLVPYVLLQFGCMYLCYRWCRKIKPDHTPVNTDASSSQANSVAAPKKTFSSKLATGFVLSLLFTYQMLATTSLRLLNCVPVGDNWVLFIEGTVVCYQGWQYGVMAYVGSCIVPFCLVLLIGPGLMKDGLVSLPQFFCACVVPLPFLFHWFIIRAKLHGKRPGDDKELSAEPQAVIQILQGPFKDNINKFFGPLCGAGIVIGRRLILVLLFTFVNDTLIRMLCMMLVCFIILLHHVHVLPYKDTRCNVAGTMSAAALVIVGAINLVRAGFEAAEYTPLGPNATLMAVFEELENCLMLWFPVAVMSVVVVAVALKILLIIMNSGADRNRQQ